MELMHVFGRELRDARYARAWSREHLAEEANVTVADIDALEKGESEVGRAAVLAALQLTEMYMLTPPVITGFLEIADPLIKRIGEDRLQLVLAEMLVVLGRAAGWRDGNR